MTGRSFAIAEALAGISVADGPNVVGDYTIAGPAMVGVIRIGTYGTQGFWECHDGGDELLVVIAGRMTMTLKGEEGPTRHALGPGDGLLIPRGVPHSGTLHDAEVRILFVSPRDGNRSWTDDPGAPRRH